MALPSARVVAVRRREQHPNLVAAWGFDEGAGTTVRDTSEHNVPLTVDVGLTWVAGHTGGFAISNTGAGSAHRTWNLTNQITVMCWARPTELTAGTSRAIMGVWNTTDTSGSTYLALWAQRSDFGTANVLQANARIDGSLVAISQSALTLNAWVHVALTYDGTTLRLFRNGVQVGSDGTAGSLELGQLHISVVPDPANTQVDDVRVFNTNLNAAQITAFMGDPVAP